MPIAPTTVFFEDYFEDDSLDNYEPDWLDPPVLKNYYLPANANPSQSPHPAVGPISRLSNHSYRVEPGGGPGGENCLLLLPVVASCPACEIEELLWPGLDNCGTPFGICDFGQLFVRWRTEAPTDWYHARAWVRLDGNLGPIDGGPSGYPNWAWEDDAPPGEPGNFSIAIDGVLAILMPKEVGYDPVYGASGELLDWRPAVSVTVGHYYYNGGPSMRLNYPGGLNQVSLCGAVPWLPTYGAGCYWPPGEWVCVELGVGDVDQAAGTGTVKLWINGKLVESVDWTTPGYVGLPGVGTPIGFAFGAMSQYGGLGTPSETFPFNGTLLYHAAMSERHEDRRWGCQARWARVASADGPIGCHTRIGGDTENPVDPDALICRAADDYVDANALRGDCGRAICNTRLKTRESWETIGAGFSSDKSFWYSWTAPRTGRYIWRTRGSEVFNELSVHRHTGTLPPLLVASAADDPWDPDATTSSAVEIAAIEGMEYRIRVAAASDGWVVLDFGPPLPMVQDDGWTINESERATRSRVSAAETISGLAVEDDQIAAASNGAGAARTLDGILWG